MIGWKDAHDGVGVDGLKDVRRQTDRRSGIPLGRFGQNLVFGNFGQLAHDFGAEMVVGQNPQALRRNDWTQAIDSLLDQRAVA